MKLLFVDGYYFIPVYGTDPVTDQRVLIENKKDSILEPGQDPQLGLDSFGDIIIENDDIGYNKRWMER